MWQPTVDKMKRQSESERLSELERKLNKYITLSNVAELEKRVDNLEKKLLLNQIEMLQERVEELEKKKNDK